MGVAIVLEAHSDRDVLVDINRGPEVDRLIFRPIQVTI